jgi:sugar phosphate isomerase/epimerase
MTERQAPADGLSRRNFLALSGAIPAMIAAQSLAGRAVAAATGPATAMPPVKKYPIGLEMYSVRNEGMHDMPNTLRNVAKMGYEVVEFYAPYFEWTVPQAKDIRALLDDLGLRCYSTHNHLPYFTPDETIGKVIELNQILGCRILVLATAPNDTNGLAGWTKLCGLLTTTVDLLKPHGLALGFHNHNTEWAPLVPGQRIMDFLAANTPREFVLQLDVGTCVAAGADPVAWINANPGRIRVIHLKDWAPGGIPANPAAGVTGNDKGYRALFGEGVSPWREIFAAAESVGGLEYYLMEQEGSRYSEFETAQRCLDTWKTMRATA